MSRSIAVTIVIKGDDGISDRQAIEEVNEALAAAGRHPLAVRQATTYEVRLVENETEILTPIGPYRVVYGIMVHDVPVPAPVPAPMPEWTPPEDNSRRAAGRKPRRKP